ncbi:MAG: biotin transporter BioY [Acutalibacteraceae bacterium]
MEATKANKRTSPILMIILAAMFAAIGAVTSWISIPMPSGVPITLQTFGMALIGYTLGYKYGTLSVGVYVALGAIGVPVFSGFKGGFGVIAGPTGGFIIGFIFMAAICGLCRLNKIKSLGNVPKIIISIALGIIGLLVCHLLGVIQFMLLFKNNFIASALTVSIPYLIKDIISVVAAYFVSVAAGALIEKIAKVKI